MYQRTKKDRKRQGRASLDSLAKQVSRQKRELRRLNNTEGDILDEVEEEHRERIQHKRRRREAILQPKIPEVNKVNFEHFKNRYGAGKPAHAIDVLVGGRNLQPQIRRELILRRKEKLARFRRAQFYEYRQVMSAQPGGGDNIHHENTHHDKVKKDDKPSGSKPDVALDRAHIHRVRVQSRPVLAYLTRLLKSSEKQSWPRTFFRPFRPLVYFQPQMKRALEDLEEKFQGFEEIPGFDDTPRYEEASGDSKAPDSAGGGTSGAAAEQDRNDDLAGYSDDDFDSDSDMESVLTDDENLEEIMQTPEALRDMRCYVEFIDREIIPLYNRFNDGMVLKVAFEDLWSLFRVGELVYLPLVEETSERYHQLWRIYRIESPRPHYSYPDINNGWLSFDDPEEEEDDEFTLFCYYIDYDGSSYGAVRHKFVIKSFPDERDIDSLEVYPLRFYGDRDALLESQQEQGRNFQKFLENRYQAYNGWTLTRNPPRDHSDPDDEIMRDHQGNKMQHPEFVESHVIVDLEEAFQSNSDWRPYFHRPSASKALQSEIGDDNMPIQHWTSRSRTRLLYTVDEAIQSVDGIEMRQRKDNISVDTFLQRRTKESRAKAALQKGPMSLSDKDLELLPKRLFAYALRERRFVPIDMNYLKPIVHVPNVFDNLKIPEKYKKVLRGLVNSHFHKRGLERNLVDNRSTEGLSQDLIQGKGRGLVILLHGVPGVGKTATAEAVAIETKKPLFVITCGDLGLTAEAVETRLSNVFRLAHLWDCVLLLDEADVFLSQRSRLDMKRNALVSVFLRVLEYYHGLLFLTTNRVGTIDEAFKSRIHISLYYPMLNKTQTEAIFRVNVDKLRAMDEQRAALLRQPVLEIQEEEILEFAGHHFDVASPTGAGWNGRQIRNAFQIAAGIAYYTYAHQVERARTAGHREPYAPVLDRRAFEEVQEVTQNFEDYIRETKGWTDADLAYLMAERADHLTNVKHAGGIRTARNADGVTGVSPFSGMFPPRDMGMGMGMGMGQGQGQGHGYGADDYHDSNRARYAPGPGTHGDRGYDPAPRSHFPQGNIPHHHHHQHRHQSRHDASGNGAQAPLGSGSNYLNPETPPRHFVPDQGYGYGSLSDGNNVYGSGQGQEQAALRDGFGQMRVGSPRLQPPGPTEEDVKDYRVS